MRIIASHVDTSKPPSITPIKILKYSVEQKDLGD